METTCSPVKTVNLHPAERWMSLCSGGMLLLAGLRKRSSARPLELLAGAEMLRRAVTGHCFLYQAFGIHTAPHRNGSPKPPLPYELGVHAHAAITIRKPRAEVFWFWRSLENMPLFMTHVKSVRVDHETGRSHWIVEGPRGKTLEWNAEMHNEIANELIAWRSLEPSDVDSAGSVHFTDARDGEGTEVRVKLQYNPPAGAVGALVAKLFGRDPQQELESSLDRLKQYMETGEIASTEGQPKGDPQAHKQPSAPRPSADSEVASQEVFQ